MRIWVILSDKFVCRLNNEKVQERLLFEDKSIEEVFKMALATKLAIADAAQIKNKDTENLCKIGVTKKSSAEIQKGKRLVFGCSEKWHERRIQCPAWGENLFKCQKKNHFSRRYKNEQRESLSHYTYELDTYDIPL